MVCKSNLKYYCIFCMISRNSCIVKLDLFVKQIPWWIFVIFANIVIFSLNLSFSETGFAEEQISTLSISNSDLLVSGLFLAPLLETFFIQLVPIEITIALCQEIFHRKIPALPILVSAFLFALIHRYNLIFLLFTFITGVILASCYIIFRRQKHYGYAYLITFILHAVVNLSSYIFNTHICIQL